MQSRSNGTVFWPVLAAIATADVVTKGMAERMLSPQRIPHDVAGTWLRLTLVYNPGAAFGLNLGSQSRWIFTALTIIALVILGRLYLSTTRGDLPRTFALSMVCAGALGNLLDRLRSEMGVVDFLDVGIGDARWPTFNVADMAVSVGAILLAWVLWQEDRVAMANERRAALAVPAAAGISEQGDLV
ncbi:MAG: Lipoprotein signal peptidase [Gemmatimonadetes bacterium]|nr:Lipoprotein signal peptidase [Gemmatimonadota bacterium]